MRATRILAAIITLACVIAFAERTNAAKDNAGNPEPITAAANEPLFHVPEQPAHLPIGVLRLPMTSGGVMPILLLPRSDEQPQPSTTEANEPVKPHPARAVGAKQAPP